MVTLLHMMSQRSLVHFDSSTACVLAASLSWYQSIGKARVLLSS